MLTELRCKTRVSMATQADRQRIYEMRHDVFAVELGQHKANAEGVLTDSLDAFNQYIVAHVGGELAGFVSITPPGFASYSIDKYATRDELPIQFDDDLYEVRLLTVAEKHRRGRLAETLMYAAFRWVEDQRGKRIVAMGRTEVLSIYLKCGLRPLQYTIRCGSVQFELLETSIESLRKIAERGHERYKKLQDEVIWDLDVPFFKAACCFHGGAFFAAIGSGFETLERRHDVINADVLDAWFPPSPKVIDAMRDHLPWLMRTSPPTHCEGMRDAIARFRGVSPENILPGAGSSDLIYLAFRQWLTSSSRVLILDPTYGEYMHVLTNVIRCNVERLTLSRSNQYALDLDELRARIQVGYDLIVLVNPNNPTGQHIPRIQLERILQDVPWKTRVWIDEAYVEYVGPDESLERFAAKSESVLVCKSMSKVYALSGMRAAYLCGPMHQLAELIPWTPPWAVSLVAQVAAVRALEDPAYYAEKYAQTHLHREKLIRALRSLGIEEIVPSRANFVMCHLEPDHPTVAEVIKESRESGVFLRDVTSMGMDLGARALRIAVKDEGSNQLVLDTLEKVLCGTLHA
ncbi:MAG TPA: aminotransferase class I/II-fold pyridoxal phosphate-dependent enzyme [Terracidiphilus sp.]|jgi:histidinol-phosphate/aromatic aminotransferase/cobyric acid decarboxylase-like protein